MKLDKDIKYTRKEGDLTLITLDTNLNLRNKKIHNIWFNVISNWNEMQLKVGLLPSSWLAIEN